MVDARSHGHHVDLILLKHRDVTANDWHHSTQREWTCDGCEAVELTCIRISTMSKYDYSGFFLMGAAHSRDSVYMDQEAGTGGGVYAYGCFVYLLGFA